MKITQHTNRLNFLVGEEINFLSHEIFLKRFSVCELEVPTGVARVSEFLNSIKLGKILKRNSKKFPEI